MPTLDTVVLFASADRTDKHHKRALFHMRRLRAPESWLAAFALMEFDIVLKSRGLSFDERMEKYALMIRDHPDAAVKVRNFSPSLLYLTASLEKDFRLGYFDAGVASEALQYDGVVISTDKVFENVSGLKREW